MALGEETSAAALALACDRSGLVATALSRAELGILAEGEPQDARCLSRWMPTAIDAAFDAHDVVVAPGFAARGSDGGPVLLGRGGSDLTAVFLAAELGAERVRLVKDVDGVYDRDPKITPDALRFASLGWDSARRLSRGLVQDGALDMAKARGLALEVARRRLRGAHRRRPRTSPMPTKRAPPPRTARGRRRLRRGRRRRHPAAAPATRSF